MLTGAGITLGVGLGLTSTAQAPPQTFTVGSTADTALGGACGNPSNTDCTLRDAIDASNADLNPFDQDTILFASALTGSTITLGSNPPHIAQSLYIHGPGANPGDSTVTIDGNNSYRDLEAVTGGNYAMNVTVSGLNLTDGFENGGGAGISVYSDYNGSTSFPQPTLTVQNSEITGDRVTREPDPWYPSLNRYPKFESSPITPPPAPAPGLAAGASLCSRGSAATLTIDDSTISGNTVHQGTGAHATGGSVHSLAPVTIQNPTIARNSTDGAHGSGGGVYLSTGHVDNAIQDSTISGNHTTGRYSEGGSVFLGDHGDMTITGSTISDNYTTGLDAMEEASPSARHTDPSNGVQRS